MELKDILSKLRPYPSGPRTATWAEIKGICDDGMKYGCASVASRQLCEAGGGIRGGQTRPSAPSSASQRLRHHRRQVLRGPDAVDNGAEEVDMVINIGWVKDQKWDDLLE